MKHPTTIRAQERRQRAAELYRKGYRPPEIAKETGHRLETILNYLALEGVRPRGKAHRHAAGVVDRMLILHRRFGWTYEELAEVLGRSYGSVYRQMRTAGQQSPAPSGEVLRRRERVMYFYEKDEPLSTIAYRLGVHSATVRKDLRACGVAPGARPAGWKKYGWSFSDTSAVRTLTRAKKMRRIAESHNQLRSLK